MERVCVFCELGTVVLYLINGTNERTKERTNERTKDQTTKQPTDRQTNEECDNFELNPWHFSSSLASH